MSRMPTATPARTRPVFVPALLGAVVVMSGLFFLDLDAYTIARYAVSILALIVAVLVVQHGSPAWAVPMVVVAVLWNPVYPFAFSGSPWAAGHIVAAATFIATALLVRGSADAR